MRTSNKHALLTILLLAVSASLTLPCPSAQAATPSVPQFTLNVIDNSQVISSTKVTDPYTNETITHSGYTLENITVHLKVLNQPFTPSVLPDGNTTELRYLVRFKGHFVDWGSSNKNGSITQTEGAETVFTFFKGWGHNYYESWQILPDSDGAQVDFQVKAQVGYYYQYYDANVYPYNLNVFFVCSESDWSSIQTAVTPRWQGQNVDAQPTPQPPLTTPTETPTATPEQKVVVPGQPEDSFYIASEDLTTMMQVALLVVVLCIIALLAVVFIRFSNKAASLPPPPP